MSAQGLTMSAQGLTISAAVTHQPGHPPSSAVLSQHHHTISYTKCAPACSVSCHAPHAGAQPACRGASSVPLPCKVYKHVHVPTHAHARMRTYTQCVLHTHTHTHTHTPACSSLPPGTPCGRSSRMRCSASRCAQSPSRTGRTACTDSWGGAPAGGRISRACRPQCLVQ